MAPYPLHTHTIAGAHTLPRPALEGLLYASSIPPLMGNDRVDHYDHGQPVEVTNTDLFPRLFQLGVLGLIYGQLSRYLLKVAPWNAGLPIWAGLLAFSEGRKASDTLGQLQNGLQVALPLLVGGYAGAPLGQWVADRLAQSENRRLFQTLDHPHMQALAKLMVTHQQEHLDQQIHAPAKRTNTAPDWDDDTPTRSDLKAELAEAHPRNQVLLTDLEAFKTHLQQHEVDQLPHYRQRLHDLKGELFRGASASLPQDELAELFETLEQTGQFLGKGIQRDERTVAPYFNGAEAEHLSQRLAKARQLLQDSSVEHRLKQSVEAVMQPVETLLGPPSGEARHWFSPHKLAHRQETLETLKTNLHEHFSRFDRLTMEGAFARLEQSDWLKALPIEAQKTAFNDLTRRFSQLVHRLSESQSSKVTLIKQGGPAVGFLLAAALVGNWLAKRINLTLADDFPQLARQGSSPAGHRQLEAIDRSYEDAFETIDPGIGYLTEGDTHVPSPSHYMSWVTKGGEGGDAWTLHTPDDQAQ